MKAPTLILALLLVLGMGACGDGKPGGAGPAGPPLPSGGVQVFPPAPALPADIRAFSGGWHGVWVDPDHPDRGIPEVLIVEEVISQDEVRVVLSWGDCPVCRSKAGWRRFTGKTAKICLDWRRLPEPFSRVSPDTLGNKKVLYFGYPEGRVFTFVLEDQDQLIGTDGVGAIRMSRLH